MGEGGRLTAIRFEDNELVERGGRVAARGTGRIHELATGLVIRSIGYQGLPLPGTPFDPKRSVIPHQLGRVLGTGDLPVAGLYVTGWIKRGPSGLIGTNKACAKETVAEVLADLETLPVPPLEPAALDAVLAERGVHVVSYEAWRAIDDAETARGTLKGRIREKFATLAELLGAARRP